MRYPNPFPATDGPISDELFVGRREIVGRFEEFLSRDAAERRNEVWVVVGQRGQGKSSLLRRFLSRSVGLKHCAVADVTWQEDDTEKFPLARTLYWSVRRRSHVDRKEEDEKRSRLAKAWRRALTRRSSVESDSEHGQGDGEPRLMEKRALDGFGPARYWAGELLPFAPSVPGSGGTISLSHLAPKPRNGEELWDLLAAYLHEDITSVTLMIDEVSGNEEQEYRMQRTRDLAKYITARTTRKSDRRINVLTVVSVFPKDVAYFESSGDGPRTIEKFLLSDFSLTEVEGLVQAGILESRRLTGDIQNVPPVSAAIDEVASKAIEFVGGIPNLTVALLHDAFEEMNARLARGDGLPILQPVDIERGIRIDGNQTLKRVASLLGFFRIPNAASPIERPVRRIIGALAEGKYGSGGWKEATLRDEMKSTVGTHAHADDAIEFCLSELGVPPLLVQKGAELVFRGRLLREQLRLL